MDHPLPPCKTFNKKNAITCYKLRFNLESRSFDHFELLRISNETVGEFYLIPIETLQKQTKRHLSYHKSGAFHWREDDGSRAIPRDGESDSRRAQLMVQAMAHVSGQLDGYCFARGRDVADEALATMIDIMDGYVIPPLKLLGVAETLRTKISRTIPMFVTPYQAEAQRLFAEDAKSGKQTFLSRDELATILRQSVGPQARFVQLDPKPERYVTYSHDTMTKSLAIAHRMVSEKMEDKPRAFWIAPPSISESAH